MIRHIVLFKLKPKATKEEIEDLIRELKDLEESIEQVRAMEVEMDVGHTPNSCDLVLNALFDNIEDVRTYLAHPAHIKILGAVDRLCESRMKIDYQIKSKSA